MCPAYIEKIQRPFDKLKAWQARGLSGEGGRATLGPGILPDLPRGDDDSVRTWWAGREEGLPTAAKNESVNFKLRVL